MTNVPVPEWTPNGFVLPTTQEIFDGVFAEFSGGVRRRAKSCTGNSTRAALTSLSESISASDQAFQYITTQVDPAFASGIWQDAIARIYFLERDPAEPTTVTATCSGAVGVAIPSGSLASAADGNIYAAVDGGVIGPLGTVDLEFACTIPGPIVCPATTLDRIYRIIPGWDSITNDADGVLGRDTETRAAFEARRAASVAVNARSTVSAVRGAVLEITDVLDAYVTENPTGSPQTIGGVSVLAHSLYVAAVGGTNLDVATAIFTKKAPGCNMNGNTPVTVEDTNSGYTAPYPSYTITFERPDELTIYFNVQIVDSTQVPSNAVALIQNAIIQAFAGSDGGSRAQIGSTILATRFIAPVALLGSWAQILSLTIGSISDPDATFTGAIAGTALSVSGVTGVIAIGQVVVGSGVVEGTKIVSGSGSSWVVDTSQTVGSETMYGLNVADSSVDVNIDQVPVTAGTAIAVTLV